MIHYYVMKKNPIHYAFTLLLFLSPTIVSADITTGLVALWRLDEGSGTKVADSIGKNLPGVLNNANAWEGGQIGTNSLHFNDGTNDFVDTNADILDGATTLTISAWMKRDATNDYVSVSKVASSNNDRMLISFWNDGNLYWNFSNGGNVFDSVASNDDTWHHVVLVFDGALTQTSRVAGYLDGVDQGLSASWPATAPSIAADFAIGRMYNGGLIYSDGQIDDVRVYDRALSSSDVTELYAFRRYKPQLKFTNGVIRFLTGRIRLF